MTSPFPEIIVTNDFELAAGTNATRLVVRASHITIDGKDAILTGPGRIGDTNSLERAGTGILIEGAIDVTVKNVHVHGFATGLLLRDAQAVLVTGCDFSDNYHNPAHGWGDLPPRGGILCERVRQSVIRDNRANRVWNGLLLIESDDNLVEGNDFSHCSNTAVSLWKASRNRFLQNNLSYGIRIDRAAGEVHARDSTGVLIETGSNGNYWFRNDVTYGGDGIFIRPLNRWVSRGNIFVENDTSFANNNCVESWSPGNTFIRNKANHGSYGFWLGGSDETVLFGNEAAYNGLTNGNHNAPEPGFRHGGIVIVGGSSSHTVIDGNDLHDNNGAGLAFRGDVSSQGRKWRTEHWVVQRNRIANNRYGIWGRWAETITLAANVFTNNAQAIYLTNVSDRVDLPNASATATAPIAMLIGPDVGMVGQSIRFDASQSRDISGGALNFHWWLDGPAGASAVLERIFNRPGFYRIGLTVDNGELAALAWRDLLIAAPVAQELGTEGQASFWGFELEGNDGTGRVNFEDDPHGIVGMQCLRFTPNPYPGAYAAAIYPGKRNAGWNFAGKKMIQFWIKVENPNLPGFQNAGPLVRLLGQGGQIELKPAKDANLLNDPPFSEARWLWMPMAIPIEGDSQWERKTTGEIQLDRIEAISVSLDSWGADPFTVWLDGLSIE
ncbi:MAG TPA: right-handed parallel beta-helix repeat-containing protein [Verrucomicrobiae bacterium]|nr:right-handed parallel beta-helix repeat-containing protein [Verrucomicrobiae bacterium]